MKNSPDINIDKHHIFKVLFWQYSFYKRQAVKYNKRKIKRINILKPAVILLFFILQFTDIPAPHHQAFAEDYDSNKNALNLNILGYWKLDSVGKVSGISGNEIPFYLSSSIPVFKQDVELSSSFTFNNKWYFEADFADNFTNNTLSLGYRGNKYFRSAKLSNRNITMPSDYSTELLGYGLSGGNNQAPGFSANWQSPSDKWSCDILFRYDMTLPRSAVFYGMNKVNDIIIDAKDFLYSYTFTFPEKSKHYLQEIKDIYLESNNGIYKDKNGKTYIKLSKSDYSYLESSNILFISQNIKGIKNNKLPTILITFISDSAANNIVFQTGNYSDKNTFKGRIQEQFNRAERKYNLEDFSYNLITTIENNNALIIQNSSGFSPYILANKYECNAKNENNMEISVISKNTKQTLTNYIAEINNSYYTSPQEDLLKKQNVIASVYKKDNKENLQFPFADIYPELYLNLQSYSDIAILARTYNPVSKINIGQKASSGTIQIIKNGMYIQDFIYNANTGDILLSSPLNNNEQVKVIWQEEASDFAKGNLALGMGFKLNILPKLKWDISLTAKKPVTFEEYSYSTPENIQNSFVALSTGIDYTNNNFTISDKASIALQKQNDSGKLLVSSQKDFTPKTYELNYLSGFEIGNQPVIENKILYSENNCTIKSHKGEKDEEIKGYKIPLVWDFSNKKDNNNKWAGVNIKLEEGSKLKNSSRLSIKLKLPDAGSSYKVYLQLGIKADKSFSEENKNIPAFNITDKINFNNTKWQAVEISLSDKDRAFLVSDNDARIIILPDNNKVNTKNKIYIGSYTPVPQSIFTSSDENINIYTTSVPSGKNFFSSEIKWNYPKEIDLDNYVITASSNFTPSDFNPYKKINFKFAYEAKKSDTIKEINKPDLSIILEDYPSGQNETIAVKLDIYDLSQYIENKKHYHTISIDIKNRLLFIDNKELEKTKYNLYINNKIIPSKVKYEINTIIKDKLINNGSFYIDNITFEESDFVYEIQNNINTSYKKENIWKIKDFPILENGFIKANSLQKFINNNTNILSSFSSGITIAGISFQGDITLKENNLTNGEHIIKTSTPLFNLLEFNEFYKWNKTDSISNKSNAITLNIPIKKVPISFTSDISAKYSGIQKEQEHNSVLTGSFNTENNKFTLTSSINTNQKINLIKNKENYTFNQDYFNCWHDITKFQFSTGDKLSSHRNTLFSNNFTASINNSFIAPGIGYNLSSIYENTNKATFTDKTTLSFNFPVTLKNNFISFNMSRTGGNISDTITDYTYFSDLERLFNLQKEKQWFYKTVPFYELFDTSLPSKIKGKYSAKYEIKDSRKLSNSFKDLFIPAGTSFTVIRDVKNLNNLSDTYQFSLSFENTSINNFGKYSKKQIFQWFNQEEITSSFTGTLKIPTDKPENKTYELSYFLQILIWINETSMINNVFDCSFEAQSDFYIKNSFIYKRPGKTSLISAMAVFFFEKAKDINFDITIRDSFNLSIENSESINSQTYEYNHFTETAFLDNFTISTGIGAGFNYTEKSTNEISLNYSIGGKITF